ncbi:hypothetical protein Z043_100127 [Scleropages formosus]|uniref:PH domain-containing protein n=1 Tax=Scleropages formosus TaxID=113540 RepID=A0A0N8K3D5_SCLFO|nr:hypothetical protein Z043_100127 [Scleropages formosus]
MDFEEIPIVAAQDLSNILKQGFLEKKRRDHSFFGAEWQKRWCVLNNTIFYYFGSEKDKQQKGSFHINGYSVELVSNLRKDSRKNACFELSAPGRRSYQVRAEEKSAAFDEGINLICILPPAGSQEERKSSREEDRDDDDDDIYEVLPEWAVDYASYYQGLWDCEPDEPDELAFQRGDLIHIISKVDFAAFMWWSPPPPTPLAHLATSQAILQGSQRLEGRSTQDHMGTTMFAVPLLDPPHSEHNVVLCGAAPLGSSRHHPPPHLGPRSEGPGPKGQRSHIGPFHPGPLWKCADLRQAAVPLLGILNTAAFLRDQLQQHNLRCFGKICTSSRHHCPLVAAPRSAPSFSCSPHTTFSEF